MSDRGYQLCEYEGDAFTWKRCEVAACENLVCHGLSETFCFVHAPGKPAVKKLLLDATTGVYEDGRPLVETTSI